MESSTIGVAVTILAGAVGSSTLAPMKYVERWNWENTWLVYTLHAYVAFPLLMALVTIPGLVNVYREAGGAAVGGAILWGLGWGVGVLTYGLALSRVGLSLTSGIIFGCSVALGSLVPLAFLHPEKAASAEGLRIVGANALLLVGVGLCAWAGGLRGDRRSTSQGGEFGKGLALCFLSGALSPMINLALAFGEPITRSAVNAGTSSTFSANAVWALTVSAGAFPSLTVCLRRLTQNKTWDQFKQAGSWRNAGLCVLMGALFIGSTVIYGSAASLLGSLGTVLGWPIYLSSLILGNNFWGWYFGEWTGAARQAVWLMAGGVGVQVAAIATLSNIR